LRHGREAFVVFSQQRPPVFQDHHARILEKSQCSSPSHDCVTLAGQSSRALLEKLRGDDFLLSDGFERRVASRYEVPHAPPLNVRVSETSFVYRPLASSQRAAREPSGMVPTRIISWVPPGSASAYAVGMSVVNFQVPWFSLKRKEGALR
jgi:hypothetical protein